MKSLDFDTFAEKVANAVLENEGSGDVTTLFNAIYGHDLRKNGYNWTKFIRTAERKKIQDVYNSAPVFTDRAGGFILGEAEEKSTQPKLYNGNPLETNTYDPRIFSTNPDLINCAAFMQGHCRISGRVCIYDNTNMEHCGIRQTVNTDPQYWEIPFGRESDPAYAYGYKA